MTLQESYLPSKFGGCDPSLNAGMKILAITSQELFGSASQVYVLQKYLVSQFGGRNPFLKEDLKICKIHVAM